MLPLDAGRDAGRGNGRGCHPLTGLLSGGTHLNGYIGTGRYEWSWLKYNTCPPHRRPLGRCAEPNRRCSGARARWARIAIPRATLPVAWPATRTRWRPTRGRRSASLRWPPTLASHATKGDQQAGQGGPLTVVTATVITPRPEPVFPALKATPTTPVSARAPDRCVCRRVAGPAPPPPRAPSRVPKALGKARAIQDRQIRHKHLKGLKGRMVFFR